MRREIASVPHARAPARRLRLAFGSERCLAISLYSQLRSALPDRYNR